MCHWISGNTVFALTHWASFLCSECCPTVGITIGNRHFSVKRSFKTVILRKWRFIFLLFYNFTTKKHSNLGSRLFHFKSNENKINKFQDSSSACVKGSTESVQRKPQRTSMFLKNIHKISQRSLCCLYILLTSPILGLVSHNHAWRKTLSLHLDRGITSLWFKTKVCSAFFIICLKLFRQHEQSQQMTGCWWENYERRRDGLMASGSFDVISSLCLYLWQPWLISLCLNWILDVIIFFLCGMRAEWKMIQSWTPNIINHFWSSKRYHLHAYRTWRAVTSLTHLNGFGTSDVAWWHCVKCSGLNAFHHHFRKVWPHWQMALFHSLWCCPKPTYSMCVVRRSVESIWL